MIARTRRIGPSFSTTAKWLHWIVAVLMLSILPVAIGFSFLDPADRAEAIPVHVSLALIVLILTLVRLGVRAASPPPRAPKSTPRRIAIAAKGGHFLLYALILWQALLGIWMAASSPVDIRFFNGVDFSSLAPSHPAVIEMLRPIHLASAWLFGFVLVGHICGALWHHFRLRDDVLIRMLPFSAMAERIARARRLPDWRLPSESGYKWPKGRR